MKKKTIGKTQYKKSKLRQTAAWRQLRVDIQDKFDDKDPITNKKLLKGFNVHHMRMAEETYDDLDMNYFLPLNRATHETLHFLVRYAQKDPEFMSRINIYVEQMVELNPVK